MYTNYFIIRCVMQQAFGKLVTSTVSTAPSLGCVQWLAASPWFQCTIPRLTYLSCRLLLADHWDGKLP